MPRQVVRLTDKKVATTKPKEKEFTLSDGEGLQLRVRPNGTKSWQFKYYHPVTKKITKITLGAYPEITLSMARKVVIQYREQVANGEDPKARLQQEQQKARNKHLTNFYTVAQMWHERKQNSVTEAHSERIWRALEMYVFPEWKNLPIDSITRSNAIALLRPLEKDGKLSTVKRICQSLNQIMEYAVDCDLLTANPLTRMINAFEQHKVTHMATIPPDMLCIFLNRLNSCTTIQNKTKFLLLWQLHTMTRPKEAARTRWKDINWKTKSWLIPASEMKRNRDHKIPLSPQAIDILKQMKSLSSNHEYVFPSERRTGDHISVFTANAALKRSLNFKNQLVAHGLRSIASTTLHEQGFDSLLIETCLSHLDHNETRASYLRSDFFEQRKEIMNWWSDHINKVTG